MTATCLATEGTLATSFRVRSQPEAAAPPPLTAEDVSGRPIVRGWKPSVGLCCLFGARNPHLIIWQGERIGSYWLASSTGLAEVPDAETLNRLFPALLELW